MPDGQVQALGGVNDGDEGGDRQQHRQTGVNGHFSLADVKVEVAAQFFVRHALQLLRCRRSLWLYITDGVFFGGNCGGTLVACSERHAPVTISGVREQLYVPREGRLDSIKERL